MIKNMKIFGNKKMKKDYDLVTIRKYNGVEDGMHAWVFLSYAIVEKTVDNKAVCFRDKNIEYKYAKKIQSKEVKEDFFCDYSDINIGDIKIFSTNIAPFDRKWNEKTMYDFMQNSGLYFEDDTKYGTRIDSDLQLKKRI